MSDEVFVYRPVVKDALPVPAVVQKEGRNNAVPAFLSYSESYTQADSALLARLSVAKKVMPVQYCT